MPTHSVLRITTIFSVALTLGAARAAVAQTPAPAAASTAAANKSAADAKKMLSAPTRDALDAKWQGWQLATGDQPSMTACGGGATPTADFDGDGSPDTAILVKTKDGASHLVVVLARPTRSMAYEVPASDAGSAGSALVIHKRGQRFRTAAMTYDDYFTSDTLGTGGCDAGAAVWLWAGAGFRKVTLTK